MSELTVVCSCGYTLPSRSFGINADGSCACNDCTGLDYPKDGSFTHADFCRQQKEKKAAEEKEKENAAPPRKCGCGDEFGHPRRPVKKPPAAEVGVTHDASGYPLPGKCVCGYQLYKYDSPPRDGKCGCAVCCPSTATSYHYTHCLRKLKDRMEEMQRTIDAQSDILTVKDDRIAELEKQLAEKEEYRSGTSYVYLGRERPESPLFVDRAVGTCEFVQSTSRNIELRFARHVDHLVICYPEEKPTRPLIRVSNGIRDPFTVSNPVEEIKRLDSVISNMRGELAESRITIAAKDKQINEQAHQLQEKQVQIDTMRAQIEGLEHDKATLHGEITGLKHRIAELEGNIALYTEGIGKISGDLAKAKAQIKELESIIAAYARDDSCKTGVINELTEQMVHFKKYRKFIIRIIRQRVYSAIMFKDDKGTLTDMSAFQIDQYLSVFPELRHDIFTDVADSAFRLTLAHDQGTHATRANLIAYANKLLNYGAEHGPASGSAPESR